MSTWVWVPALAPNCSYLLTYSLGHDPSWNWALATNVEFGDWVPSPSPGQPRPLLSRIEAVIVISLSLSLFPSLSPLFFLLFLSLHQTWVHVCVYLSVIYPSIINQIFNIRKREKTELIPSETGLHSIQEINLTVWFCHFYAFLGSMNITYTFFRSFLGGL